MKNTFGNSLSVTLFGESHGPAVGVVLDGLAPGLEVDEKIIAEYLAKRRPNSKLDTARKEKDEFEILSGVFNGKTTGTPLTISIPNKNVKSKDYTYGEARPSHADYTASVKYHGFEDYRGGGHFSGRITAALVAAGGIIIPALEKCGISIGTHMLSCGSVAELSFLDMADLPAALKELSEKDFPVVSDFAAGLMKEEIENARKANDSVGGITETAITGLPAGLGEPWFDSMESMLSHMMFSIGAVKGVQFGRGFEMSESLGSEVNDAMRYDRHKKLSTSTNNNGGINGGITNGMPVIFSCAFKPTPSIGQTQKSIDFVNKKNIDLNIHGRHDPAIVKRACPVVSSAAAIVIADMLCQRYGTDVLKNGFK